MIEPWEIAVWIGAFISCLELATAAWVGLKVKQAKRDLTGLLARKETEILKRYEEEKAALPELIGEAAEPWIQKMQDEVPAMLIENAPAIAEALQPMLSATIDELMPALIAQVKGELTVFLTDFAEKGAQTILGNRGNTSQAIQRAAAAEGIDLEGIMSKISPEQMQQGITMLQSGGQLPQGDIGSILKLILGESVKGFIPAKYRKLLPPGFNPMSLLSGVSAGGGSRGNGGGYNPGIG